MKMGRRFTIILGNICIIIGATVQATTFSVAQIIVGRIICGFGIGFIASAVPTYMVGVNSQKGIYLTELV